MQAKSAVGPVSQLTHTVWRMVERLFSRTTLATAASADASPVDLPSLDHKDAYTVFEGSPSRFRRLSIYRPLGPVEDPESAPGAFRIRLAHSRDSRQKASSLVRLRYASRGYQVERLKTDAPLFTFVAFDVGSLVGTVSLRLDSPLGLAADDLYKDEIDNLRHTAGLRLCEFTRLAVDSNAGSKPVLASLFHTAYLFAHRLRGYEGAVIEVNPRHVAFYKRALGFEAIGPERLSTRVNAPAVLLYVSFRLIASGLATYAGKPELARSTHSLFPYGFSARDEDGILGRLRALGPSGS